MAASVAGGSGPGIDERHPLAVSVNRDEHISATRPRILSFQSLSSQPRAHRTLGSRTLVAPKRTSHPSGSRPSRLAARRPLAAFAAPENPLFPTASNNRSRTCQPHSCVASPIGDPTPCGSRYGRNELIDMGGDRRRRAISCDGSANARSTLPAPSPLIGSTPVVLASHPKAFAASNGAPSLITW